MRRSVAGEAARLVADLLTGDPVRAEAARARLLVLGARAVPHVLDALAEATGGGVETLLGVLALLPPTREAAQAVDDAAARAEAAAGIGAQVWRCWLRAADREISTLAFDRLAAIALDEAAPRDARRLAADAVGELGGAAAAALLARLPDEVRSPQGHGADASTPDVVNSAAGVRDYVTAHGPTAPLPDLHRMLDHVRTRQRDASNPSQAAEWLAVRGALHQALAGRGSTVALYDLRELFERAEDPPPIGAVVAMRQIGDAGCLDAIAAAWTRVTDQWTRDRLREITVEICERHRLTGRHAVVRRLAARAPSLAEAITTRRTRTAT